MAAAAVGSSFAVILGVKLPFDPGVGRRFCEILALNYAPGAAAPGTRLQEYE